MVLEGLALLPEWRTGLSSVHAGTLAEAERVLDDAGGEPACVVVDLDLPYRSSRNAPVRVGGPRGHDNERPSGRRVFVGRWNRPKGAARR